MMSIEAQSLVLSCVIAAMTVVALAMVFDLPLAFAVYLFLVLAGILGVLSLVGITWVLFKALGKL